jgi:hypothetical protein
LTRKEPLDLPLEEIEEEYLSGKTFRELGEKYGCTAMTIWRKLTKFGTKTRTRGNPKGKNYEREAYFEKELEELLNDTEEEEETPKVRKIGW